jgi:hypothetical protein
MTTGSNETWDERELQMAVINADQVAAFPGD